MTEQRCPAAHPEDPTPCDGPPVVTVLDRNNAGAEGCEHHGARLLASLEGGRVYALPGAPAGAAIRVFKAADGIRPFPWMEDAPRTRPEQLSRRENREGSATTSSTAGGSQDGTPPAWSPLASEADIDRALLGPWDDEDGGQP